MRTDVAEELMLEFAKLTGVSGAAPPRRYLWTDAFAVCNFLGLYRETRNDEYLRLALELVDQVHHVLGRHRMDDSRTGWISGLSDRNGELHPTAGGLRIGKKLNERGADQPPDRHQEWDQDGQYFHYLTKWMHALYQVSRVTEKDCYLRWAIELAVVSHKFFTYQSAPGDSSRMVWKMSIDLSRPLVSSMGQHDPLDGLITCLELDGSQQFVPRCEFDLEPAITDFTSMCAPGNWATQDSLGIGSLLETALRLAQMVVEQGVKRHGLLVQLLSDADVSLRSFVASSALRQSAENRLAFREFGLSTGLHGIDWIAGLVVGDRELAAIVRHLLVFRSLAEQIESFWLQPVHRQSQTWMDHRDINSVMFATSLAPSGYLRL